MESGYYNHEPSSPRNMESLRDRLSQEGEVRTRGTTLLSIHLFRFLCLLPAFFSTVSTIWVSPLQTDSMPGSSNAMLDPVGYSIRYFNLTSLGSGAGPAIFALGNGANKQIKAFDQSGSPLFTFSASQLALSVSDASVAVALNGKPRLFVSNGQVLYSYDISTNPPSPGTYTLTYSSQFNFQTIWNPAGTVFHYIGFLQAPPPGTNYLFMLARIQVVGARDYVRPTKLDLQSDDISVSPNTRYSISNNWNQCPLPTSPVRFENSFQLEYW